MLEFTSVASSELSEQSPSPQQVPSESPVGSTGRAMCPCWKGEMLERGNVGKVDE